MIYHTNFILFNIRIIKNKTNKHMKKVTNTHNGKKTATTVINDGFALYFSKANAKSESTYLTLSAVSPETGKFTKVRLTGRQVAALRSVIA